MTKQNEKTKLIQNDTKQTITKNIFILGDEKVGKTTLINSINSIKSTNLKLINKSTILCICKYEFKNYILELKFIDTIYTLDNINSSNISFKNIHFIFLCFDINRDYQDQLNRWITYIKLNSDIPFFIIGCKLDLRNKNSVNTEKTRAYSLEKGGTNYIECSALKKENIDVLINLPIKEFKTEYDNKTKCIIL